MRAVNLLPQDEQRPGLENARVPLIAAGGATALVVVAAAALVFSASGTADGLRADLEGVELEIAAVPQPQQQAVSQGVLALERSNRVTALAAALTTRVAFDRLFHEISYVLPQDAWLTQMTAATPLTAPAAAGTPGQTAGADDVTIQGSTYSHDAVARVLSRLAAVPSLANVRLVSSERADLESSGAKPGRDGKVVVTFTIAAALRQEGTP